MQNLRFFSIIVGGIAKHTYELQMSWDFEERGYFQ